MKVTINHSITVRKTPLILSFPRAFKQGAFLLVCFLGHVGLAGATPLGNQPQPGTSPSTASPKSQNHSKLNIKIQPSYLSANNPHYKRLQENISQLPQQHQQFIKANENHLSPEDLQPLNASIETQLKVIQQNYLWKVQALKAAGKWNPDREQKELTKLENNKNEWIQKAIGKRIGQNRVLSSLQSTSDGTHSVVSIREMNPDSYAIVAQGAPTKSKAIKGKTADINHSQILAGYIPYDAKFSKAGGTKDEAHYTQLNQEAIDQYGGKYQKINLTRTNAAGQTEYAVYSQTKDANGNLGVKKEKWKTQAELDSPQYQGKGIDGNSPKYIKHEIMGQKVSEHEILPITADADMAFTGSPKKGPSTTEKQIVKDRETQGFTTPTDLKVIQHFNSHMGSENLVMHHGPASFDPSNTPLGHNEAVYIAIPGQKTPILVQGEKNGLSTQQKLDKMTKQGVLKNYVFQGTNTSMMGMTTPGLVIRDQESGEATPAYGRKHSVSDQISSPTSTTPNANSPAARRRSSAFSNEDSLLHSPISESEEED